MFDSKPYLKLIDIQPAKPQTTKLLFSTIRRWIAAGIKKDNQMHGVTGFAQIAGKVIRK